RVDRQRSAGLDQDLVALLEESAAELRRLRLQHRLATGDLDPPDVHGVDGRDDRLEIDLGAALEGVGAIAPDTAQIAERRPHEPAREPGPRRLALDRLEDFGDAHRPAKIAEDQASAATSCWRASFGGSTRRSTDSPIIVRS